MVLPAWNRFSNKFLFQDGSLEIGMSSAIGAMLLTVSLTAGVGDADKSVLPRPILEAGLKKAHCTLPPRKAEIIGTERLSNHLRIVEVSCWKTSTNDGSILFAVPVERKELAQLVTVDHWHNGKVVSGYSVASPGYEAKTRTLSSTYKADAAGDCGTIQEMEWTGWHFQLLNVWRKDKCDGQPFEWDSRDRWQVFPQQAAKPDPDEPVSHDTTVQAAR
jgi:Protein of unknown function (DUF1176)